VALLLACTGLRPVPLASHVDLEAMQGGWTIVATIPNHFESGDGGTTFICGVPMGISRRISIYDAAVSTPRSVITPLLGEV